MARPFPWLVLALRLRLQISLFMLITLCAAASAEFQDPRKLRIRNTIQAPVIRTAEDNGKPKIETSWSNLKNPRILTTIHARVFDAKGAAAKSVVVNLLYKTPQGWEPKSDPRGFPQEIAWREANPQTAVWVPVLSTTGGDPLIIDILTSGTYRIYIQETGQDKQSARGSFALSEPISAGGLHEEMKTEIKLQGANPAVFKLIDSATRRPIPNASLLLYRADGLPIGDCSSRWRHALTTGTIELSALPAGDYHAAAWRPPFKFNETHYEKRERIPVKIKQSANQFEIALVKTELTPVEVDLHWPFVVEGTVADAQGKPIPGAEISVSAGMGTLLPMGSAASAADGRYTLRFAPGMTSPGGQWPENIPGQFVAISAARESYRETSRSPQGNLVCAGKPESLDSPLRNDLLIQPLKPFRLDFVMSPAPVPPQR